VRYIILGQRSCSITLFYVILLFKSNLRLGRFELYYVPENSITSRSEQGEPVKIFAPGPTFRCNVQNFDILAGDNDEPVIAIHPSSHFVSNNSDSKREGKIILNGLCHQVSSSTSTTYSSLITETNSALLWGSFYPIWQVLHLLHHSGKWSTLDVNRWSPRAEDLA